MEQCLTIFLFCIHLSVSWSDKIDFCCFINLFSTIFLEWEADEIRMNIFIARCFVPCGTFEFVYFSDVTGENARNKWIHRNQQGNWRSDWFLIRSCFSSSDAHFFSFYSVGIEDYLHFSSLKRVGAQILFSLPRTQYFPFYRPNSTSNMFTSLGEMPGIRLACPMVSGSIRVSFWRASVERDWTEL